MTRYTLIVLISFGFGLSMGVFLAPLVEETPINAGAPVAPSPLPTLSPSPDAPNELAAARMRISELQERIKLLEAAGEPKMPKMIPTPGIAVDKTTQPSAPPTSTASPNRITWRISAIEKFVPLSEEQRNRLTVKFEREAAGEESSESLEDILGGESATFYREQVKAAFERARNEEVDREIVWLGRQLALTSAQERDIKAAFDAVEVELSAVELPESVRGKTPEERVKAMIAENKRREELRQERLKTILTPDQFTAYSRIQAESTQSDIEVFHGAN